MLERLSFSLGGPLTADRWQVEVSVRERKVYIGCRQYFEGEDPMENLPLAEFPAGRRWLRRLERLGIQRWRSRFVPEQPAKADTQWKLLYKETGRPQRNITGYGAYPDNWTDFIDWLNELPGAAIRQENHLESVHFFLKTEIPAPPGSKKPGKKIPIQEKLVLDRRRRVIIYNRHKQELGAERHAYEIPRKLIPLLDRLDVPMHFEEAWPTLRKEGGPELTVKIVRHDRTEINIRCRYAREELPVKWPKILTKLREVMGGIDGCFFHVHKEGTEPAHKAAEEEQK